jgi:hypothetical protein
VASGRSLGFWSIRDEVWMEWDGMGLNEFDLCNVGVVCFTMTRKCLDMRLD